MKRRSPATPGVVPVLGLLSIVTAVGLVTYELGRSHRDPAEMAEAARARVVHIVEPLRFVYTGHASNIEVEVEPDHQGAR